MTLELQYYVDVPGRDISIPARGSVCWIDIEPGCFQNAQEVRDQGTANTAAGLVTGIYCGRYTLRPVFGTSTELADYPLPLWHADYSPPDFASFVPYGHWQLPALWQFWSGGYCGINCDLSITPEGRLFADLSNYSEEELSGRPFTEADAEMLKLTMDGVIIGLQNADIARQFQAMLAG